MPLRVGDGGQVPLSILPPGASASPTSDKWLKERQQQVSCRLRGPPKWYVQEWGLRCPGAEAGVCQGHCAWGVLAGVSQHTCS